jgi:hypothetical protein
MLAPALFSLCLGACATAQPWTYSTDLVGTVWPEACRHDLSNDPRVQAAIVLRVSRAYMTAHTPGLPPGATVNGWYQRLEGIDVIYIADDLEGPRYLDTLHHERCHIVAGDWHDRPGHPTLTQTNGS